MPAPKAISRIVRFGVFEADLRAGELRKSGSKVKLQEQPFQVLALLLEQPGELVTREDLRLRLWPADTFVDFDHGLNAAVKRLREALGDDADNPRFVETLPRRGYRFIAPVDGSGLGPSEATAPRPVVSRRFLGVVALLVLTLGITHWFRGSRPKPQATAVPGGPPKRLVPVTSFQGIERTPALSPDGRQIAFAWDGEREDNFDIYVKLVGAESILRLTSHPATDGGPAWSPDGRYIAFARYSESENALWIVPALGGTERKLHTLNSECGWFCGLSWSPDGEFLAFSDRARGEEQFSLFLISLETQETRRLARLGGGNDINPRFSPDGTSIAFIRGHAPAGDIFLTDLAGSSPRRVTFDEAFCGGLAWTPDGREIVFSSTRAGPWNLWRIRATGGTPELLPTGVDAFHPTLSQRGDRLAFGQADWNENIWRLQLSPQGRPSAPPVKLIASSRAEEGPQYSPDGKRIVFQSTRSGSFEIWRADSDGSNLMQMTHFGGPLVGTPRWSPDGRWITFGGPRGIEVVSADGGPGRVMADDAGLSTWSRDGMWLYFHSRRSGSDQMWKMPAQGGPAVQLTRGGGFSGFESHDGKFFYYAKGLRAPGIWRVPVDGGEEAPVLDYPKSGYWGYWGLGKKGIYFVNTDSRPKPTIEFFDFATRRTRIIAAYDKTPSQWAPGLAVSPDERWILYVQLDATKRDIMLVENFR